MKRTNILKGANKLLSEIEPAPKILTAPGRRQTRHTARISISLPQELVDDLDALGGARSHWIERAVKFLLMTKNHDGK